MGQPKIPTIKHISKTVVKPSPSSPLISREELIHFSPWDLAMLTVNYIQKGLLFSNSSADGPYDIPSIIDRLKLSLAVALRHFYPLAGRFVTQHAYDEDGNIDGMFVAIQCNDNGAEFIHAVAETITVSDVLASNSDVPEFVAEFFPLDGTVTCDGHSVPLVAVQLTELANGLFLGLSFNHAVGDGTSYWHFFNAWAEICRSTAGDIASVEISRSPVLERWFGDRTPPLKLPYLSHEEFIERFSPPVLRERIFHFSAETLAKLKSKANKEHEEETEGGDGYVGIISSLQSVSALMWRCIIRARGFPAKQSTGCRLAIENRSRLRPQLHSNYFGNTIYAIRSTTTTGELLNNSLGWAASMLKRSVAEHDDKKIRELVEKWLENPVVYQQSQLFDPLSVMVGSSPRFEMYECEFGWGRGVALRSGRAHKFCGKITMYPGREGGGSTDLEVCLSPEVMEKLLEDPEFLNVVTST